MQETRVFKIQAGYIKRIYKPPLGKSLANILHSSEIMFILQRCNYYTNAVETLRRQISSGNNEWCFVPVGTHLSLAGDGL